MPDNGPTCPACGKPFGRLVNNACPVCETPLTRTRVKEGKLNVTRYVLTTGPVVEQEPESKEEKNEELIFEAAGVKIYNLGKLEDDLKHYRAEFTCKVQRVVCPECRLMAFKPNQLVGEVEHKCNRCKSITLFKFDVFAKKR